MLDDLSKLPVRDLSNIKRDTNQIAMLGDKLYNFYSSFMIDTIQFMQGEMQKI